MHNLFECLNDLYGTKDLYDVLSVKKDAPQDVIKKAYYKVSLSVHPDRAESVDRETATKKFQALSQVYSVLSDKEKRAIYDETGEIDDDSEVFKQERDWTSYWRILFKKITIEDIEDYKVKYQNSADELADIVTAYVEHKGDMDLILEAVPCCTVEDDKRFKATIDEKIKMGEVPEFKLFKQENTRKQDARRKKANAEAAEAAELQEEMELKDSEDDLKVMILKRQQDRAQEMDSFFDQLASKYSKPSKKAKAANGTKKKGKKDK